MSELHTEPLVVCLGYPAVQGPDRLEQLRQIDPRIEPVVLPVDPGGGWLTAAPGEPFDEPPPWATGVAEERSAALSRAEVLIALQISKHLMNHCPRLRWLQGIGAGVEQFAKAGVRRDQVIVTNASGLSANSMAEFVIGRLLQIWKRFREAGQYQRNHQYVQTYGRTLAGSTLGIVGLGSIGNAIAERASALGVRVLGLRRSHRPGARSKHAAELYGPDQLHEMLGRCDAIVLAAPATSETFHLIDSKALAALPRGAVLVNVARGSLIDEAALVEALQSGQLGGAALDVFETEPLPEDSPLWDLPNLYLSAHSSVSTDRYVEDIFELFADNLARYVRDEPLRNQVDMAALGFA
jgi:phosphoglycerate dehydrogenase-like enzyme